MSVESFVFLLFFLFCLLSFFRKWYYFLPKDEALISDILYKCEKRNNLLYIKFLIKYIVNNKEKNKAFTIILKPKYFSEKDKYISEIMSLKDSFFDFYYFPIFRNYGYLDCKLLLIPMWVYLLSLLISGTLVILLITHN